MPKRTISWVGPSPSRNLDKRPSSSCVERKQNVEVTSPRGDEEAKEDNILSMAQSTE
jgi:hypothetical protein